MFWTDSKEASWLVEWRFSYDSAGWQDAAQLPPPLPPKHPAGCLQGRKQAPDGVVSPSRIEMTASWNIRMDPGRNVTFLSTDGILKVIFMRRF